MTNKTNLFSSDSPLVVITSNKCIVDGTVSKGGQDKWCIDGVWYKADYIGYEGFAETLASRIASILNVNMPYVSYKQCNIQTARNRVSGCMSQSFLADEDVEICLNQLLPDNFSRYDVTLKLSCIIDALSSLSPLLIDQLACLFQFDRLIKNMDRHLFNIVLRKHKNNFDIILFDNGDSLTSDIIYDFPQASDLESCLAVNSAKPLLTSFDYQCKLMQKFSRFELQVVDRHLLISDLQGSVPNWFFCRVKDFLVYQFKRYMHMNIEFI